MSRQNSLTIVVLTHNDEAHIVDCLECLDFADELVVLDDESTDRTIELVRNFTDKILVRPLNGNFANQRNFALNNVHSQWVLFIDSDEYVSKKLREEILDRISDRNVTGYFLKRVDVMWGKKITHGEVGEVRLLRLGQINSGKWHGKVHEVWRVSGQTDELSNPLIHTPHQSITEFVADIGKYSTIRAQELKEAGVGANAISIIAYPTVKFIQNYVIRRGYKDGVAGFIYAMMMSFHSFLVRGKLYLEKSDP